MDTVCRYIHSVLAKDTVNLPVHGVLRTAEPRHSEFTCAQCPRKLSSRTLCGGKFSVLLVPLLGTFK